MYLDFFPYFIPGIAWLVAASGSHLHHCHSYLLLCLLLLQELDSHLLSQRRVSIIILGYNYIQCKMSATFSASSKHSLRLFGDRSLGGFNT